MAPAVLDSSCYISSLRQGSPEISLRIVTNEGHLWLSTVVLAELYAGARDQRAVSQIERLERDFRLARRAIVPNAGDWSHAGKILARLAARYDYESSGRARLLNDVLIAVSVGRIGATLITANARDFSRIAEFVPLSWRLQLP